MRGRHALLGASTTATVLLLAGCAIPLPEPSPEPPADEPMPALDTVRVERVLADLGGAIDAADADLDADLLEGRVAGPALQTRRLEYRLASATADTEDPTEPRALGTELAAPPVVSVSDGWPHTLAVIAQIAEGDNTAVLMTLRQDEHRDDYKMIGWVRLLPGVTSPEMAVPEAGSAPVAPDAEDLVRSPAATLEAYADLLQNEGGSDFAGGPFAGDDFRSAVFADREQIEAGVEDAGEYRETFERVDSDPISFRTADGGALVVGSLRSEQVYERTIDDAELTISTPALLALADSEDPIEVESTFRVTYRIMVAFYVPPEGSEDPTQVLGAERVLASAENG